MNFKIDVTKVRSEATVVNQGEVPVLFELPDGTKSQMTFRRDLTVGYLKIHVEQKHSIPYANQVLFLNDVLMADPLSLSDFPALKSWSSSSPTAHVAIKVVIEGEIEKLNKETILKEIENGDAQPNQYSDSDDDDLDDDDNDNKSH